MELGAIIAIGVLVYFIFDAQHKQIDELRRIRVLLENQIHPPQY